MQECKGIVKFYQFVLNKEHSRNTNSEWNKKKFVYLKLEQFLTIDLNETREHWNEKKIRTKSEKKGVERKIKPVRREDCIQDCNDKPACCDSSKWENDVFLGQWLECCTEDQCKNILKTPKQYNDEYRVGDEFFIPQEINDSIYSNSIKDKLRNCKVNQRINSIRRAVLSKKTFNTENLNQVIKNVANTHKINKKPRTSVGVVGGSKKSTRRKKLLKSKKNRKRSKKRSKK